MSKRLSQARWRAKNPDYHSGCAAVERVQQWRAQNPGYWRLKKPPLEEPPLQKDSITQTIDKETDNADLEEFALRENCITQLPLVLGLMSVLSGFTFRLLDPVVSATCHSIALTSYT